MDVISEIQKAAFHLKLQVKVRTKDRKEGIVMKKKGIVSYLDGCVWLIGSNNQFKGIGDEKVLIVPQKKQKLSGMSAGITFVK